MKQTTIDQINRMKSQTIGVEVEMNRIMRSTAAKIAADFFGTGRYADTARRNGYYTWSAWDAQGREWKFQKDVSIHGDDAHKCELVTPILKYDDIPVLQELLRKLRRAGAKSDATRGCGVHIHIGAQGHDPKSLRNLINIMASRENLLKDALKLDAGRVGTYCQTVNPKLVEMVNKQKPTTMAKMADVWYTANNATHGRSAHYNNSRYHMLNLHATFTKGTIEFRLFQFDAPTAERKGGIHAGAIKAYIQLCLALSQLAKDMRTASPKQPQVDNPKFAMRIWLMRMGLMGEEFATAREILTKNLAGDAAFRFGRRTA